MFGSRSTPILLTVLLLLMAVGCADDPGNQAHTAEAGETDFCQEHQIAESECPFCNPELIESLGFCHGHGVPEAFCYLCNPNLIAAFKAVGDWCGGHDRPESQCYICNPELDPAAQEQAAQEQAAQEQDFQERAFQEQTRQDSFPPMESLTRHQQPPTLRCATEDLTVRLENAEAAEMAGLQSVQAEYRHISRTIDCNAQIGYDGNRYARLSSQVPGVVASLHKEPGDYVEVGEVLVTITSAHLGSAKAAYRQAATAAELWQQNQAREADLLARGVATEKDLIDADIRLAESQIALGEAQQSLLNLGLSTGQIQDIQHANDISSAYTVTAPISGVVVDRSTAIGEVVEPARPLFAVADISRMWALIDVHESDLRAVQTGQPVVLQVAGLPGEAAGGWINWVSSQLDPHTRTLRARAEVANPQGRLLANMFARAQVTVADQRHALVVPEAAVQWEGCCNIVFVRQSPTEYKPRKVHLGIATGNVYEVLSGLEAGDEVITEGSFLLKTEILKSSIGAGCCEVDPG